MSRGNRRQQIFRDDDDYARFLITLSVTAGRFGVKCRAYCLLWNHFHLLLEPQQFPLSRMMQQLNSIYCQRFNRRHEQVGHVLQGRFKAPMIDGESYFLRALRYIVLNPVRAGLVTHPGDWRWSSYRATTGLEAAPAFLSLDPVWRAFDDDAAVAQRRFAAFVDGGPPGEFDRLGGTVTNGSGPFASQLSDILARHRDAHEVTYADRFACRPSLHQIFERHHDPAALDQGMGDAFQRHGYTLRDIGDFVGRPPKTVWRRIRRAAARADPSRAVENAKIEI
jgi:REP element-mobilizing transposase RayT